MEGHLGIVLSCGTSHFTFVTVNPSDRKGDWVLIMAIHIQLSPYIIGKVLDFFQVFIKTYSNYNKRTGVSQAYNAPPGA